MTEAEDGRTSLDQVLAPFMTSFARSMEIERQRQASYDAMELPDLKELATASLRTAANTLSTTTLTSSLRDRGWTQVETERLATYLLELADNIDEAGPWGTTNMVKWFDDVGITPQAEDELKDAAHEAMTVYNAYVRRKWPG